MYGVACFVLRRCEQSGQNTHLPAPQRYRVACGLRAIERFRIRLAAHDDTRAAACNGGSPAGRVARLESV
jgi:hypothetical protein